MKIQKSGFSLVEIIIAILLLTLGVFGIYKLMGNNMLLLSRSQIFENFAQIEQNLSECLYSLDQSSFSSYNSGSLFSLNFGEDLLGCELGVFEDNFSFSGIILDNQEFFIYGEIVDDSKKKIIYHIYNTDAGYYMPEKKHIFYLP